MSFLPAEGEAQTENGTSHLKGSELKVYFPPQNMHINSGLPTLIDLIKKKIPERSVQILGFWLILDVLELTSKNSHHKSMHVNLTYSHMLKSNLLSN